eukprot:GDKK01054510.1.p1 GENE.GDKK01054510.1~~GDKK01054510.1.p1  ORF type:complete len:700 (-),score=163.86 GDKK01054510.1:587-2686(-)
MGMYAVVLFKFVMKAHVPADSHIRRRTGLFLKIKMCPHLLAGECYKGDSCRYAHDEADISQRKSLRKTMFCRAWQSGECPLSVSECNFAHGVDDLICDHLYKTSMCEKFMTTGDCVYSSRCNKAHTLEERRTRVPLCTKCEIPLSITAVTNVENRKNRKSNKSTSNQTHDSSVIKPKKFNVDDSECLPAVSISGSVTPPTACLSQCEDVARRRSSVDSQMNDYSSQENLCQSSSKSSNALFSTSPHENKEAKTTRKNRRERESTLATVTNRLTSSSSFNSQQHQNKQNNQHQKRSHAEILVDKPGFMNSLSSSSSCVASPSSSCHPLPLLLTRQQPSSLSSSVSQLKKSRDEQRRKAEKKHVMVQKAQREEQQSLSVFLLSAPPMNPFLSQPQDDDVERFGDNLRKRDLTQSENVVPEGFLNKPYHLTLSSFFHHDEQNHNHCNSALNTFEFQESNLTLHTAVDLHNNNTPRANNFEKNITNINTFKKSKSGVAAAKPSTTQSQRRADAMPSPLKPSLLAGLPSSPPSSPHNIRLQVSPLASPVVSPSPLVSSPPPISKYLREFKVPDLPFPCRDLHSCIFSPKRRSVSCCPALLYSVPDAPPLPKPTQKKKMRTDKNLMVDQLLSTPPPIVKDLCQLTRKRRDRDDGDHAVDADSSSFESFSSSFRTSELQNEKEEIVIDSKEKKQQARNVFTFYNLA